MLGFLLWVKNMNQSINNYMNKKSDSTDMPETPETPETKKIKSKPSTKKTPTKKTATKKTSSPSPSPTPTPTDQIDNDLMEQIQKILSEAKQTSKELSIRQKAKIITDQQIHSFLSEYMDSYVLMGYNAHNRERILLRFARCEQSEDSLYELVRMAFVRMMNEDHG
jgi:hypothetical protein